MKKSNNNNDNYDDKPGPDTSALWPTSKHHQFERHVPRPGKGASQYVFVYEKFANVFVFENAQK